MKCTRNTKKVGLAVFRFGVLVFLLVCLQEYCSGLSFSQVAGLLDDISFSAAIIILPISFATLCDTFGWWLCLPEQKKRISLHELFLIRVATDALSNSLPAGVAVAEPMRPALLRKQFGIRLTDGIAASIIVKVNIAVAQGIYILFGLLLVFMSYYETIQDHGILDGTRSYLVVAAVVGGLVVGLLLIFNGSRLTQLFNVFDRVKIPQWQSFIERLKPHIAEMDTYVEGFARKNRRHMITSLIVFFMAWMFIALESFVILSLLGSDVTFTQAIVLESTASVIRIAFFFLPAGIGAQEVGFVTLLTAFGFPDPITLSAAYILVKRAKEVCWVLFGYGLFAYLGHNPFTSAENTLQA